MRRFLIASVTVAVACTMPSTAVAQRVAPVAATQRAWEPADTSAQRPGPIVATRPRPRVVAPLAFAFGVAGGVIGYYAAEDHCARAASVECYQHLLAVPLGYTIGVSVGAGIAGTAEGCRTASLRALGGGVLGLMAGAVVAAGVQPVGILVLPAGPLVGATWLVARCRKAAEGPGPSGG